MLYGGVICYNETGLCQHFSLVLTFSGCELECCVISRPSPRSSPRLPGHPALLSQKKKKKTWTGWEKERRDEWWKPAGGGGQQRRRSTKWCESELEREAGGRGRWEPINNRHPDKVHKSFYTRWVWRRSAKPSKSSICSSRSSALGQLSR